MSSGSDESGEMQKNSGDDDVEIDLDHEKPEENLQEEMDHH